MSGSKARLQAIDAVKGHEGPAGDLLLRGRPRRDLRRERLLEGGDEEASAEARLQVPDEDHRRATLDPVVADAVASAMKDWAIEKGATHYAHVFYPLTGLTAEKHDSFLSPDRRRRGIAEFPGKELIQGEPDASSFPVRRHSRHVRSPRLHAWERPARPTFWKTPTARRCAFPRRSCSWTGEALDKKTPVLRSMQA